MAILYNRMISSRIVRHTTAVNNEFTITHFRIATTLIGSFPHVVVDKYNTERPNRQSSLQPSQFYILLLGDVVHVPNAISLRTP
jgi:hypothetical protein